MVDPTELSTAHPNHKILMGKPFCCAVACHTRDVIDEARHTLEDVGLIEHMDVIAASMSRRNKRRLELAICLVQHPQLLLLDEPCEGLAPVIVQEIERILEEIKKLGITTVIVEQNAIAALHLADRAVILDMGQVVFDGTSQEVIDNEELRQQYLAI